MNKPIELIEYVKDRPGHDRRYAIENKKIIESTGWKPKTNFQEGLMLTINNYSKKFQMRGSN